MTTRTSGCPALFVAFSFVASIALAQTAPAPAPADPLVRENVTVKLGARTYVIPDGNVGLVPNVGIVVGTRATLVIDPGLGRRNGETVAREVAKISTNTELYVASTHFHAEHTTGYLAFPTAKYVNSTIQEEEFAQGGAQQIKNFAARTPVTGELLKDAHGRKADITYDREHSLDLGGVVVQMRVVGPTHTRGDTTFFVEGDRVLFAGDVVMNNSFVAANQNSSLKAWLAAFDALEALDPLFVVPAHGPVGDQHVIRTQRRVLEAIRDRALELKAQGHPADEAAAAVQKEFRSKWPTWPRANGVGAIARSAYNGT